MDASVPEFPRRLDMPPSQSVWAPAWAGQAPAPLTLRVFAYFVDLVVIATMAFVLTASLFVLGFLSLGISWLLIVPAWMATPSLYSGLMLSSRAQATIGMRLFGLHMRPVEGGHIDFLIGAAHALLFYVFGTTMTPFILLVGLIRRDRALLHDIVLRVRLVSG